MSAFTQNGHSVVDDSVRMNRHPSGVPRDRSCTLPRRSCRKWSLKDLDIGKKLGEGCFGSVYLAREKESRFVVALKMMVKSEIVSQEAMQQIQREIEIQSHLRHPGLVQLYSYFYDAKRIYLILEYVPKGELSKELARFHHFNNTRTATYLYQLSSAIAYCHQNDVIHRDIKPDNILLGSRGETKIADFGSAVHRPASRRTAPFGTLDYLAPEVIDPESSYENSVDTWSLGVLTYEMLVGQVPFVGETPQDVANQILSCEPRLPGEFDADAVELISSMLQKRPELRISLTGIHSHPWMRQHAEFSLTRCTAALLDWESPNLYAQSSTLSSFSTTDPSGSSSLDSSSMGAGVSTNLHQSSINQT
ncbi:hypothetical protein CRM22_008340 [Opisthorchis felineus]|uniref:Aurora kinase n=2 Tax=Opisthorchis felineus TaxID=147828 RepID=A0A4S2LCC0_OPIFE|nr:hypothetical protein CRM22_008340 [Opisthorchis felineus]